MTPAPITRFPTPHHPWISDVGDGFFRNPVIHADYSDPDVIRHGEDFFMVASSFNCTPGLPILHSRDLVNWKLVNHAIRNVPHPSYENVRPGCGVWAPSIRFHGGKFWIFFPLPDEGIYVTCAEDPFGEFSGPWCLQEAKGWIDPCPFWDDGGKAYLVHAYANSRAGIKERIHLRPMTPDCKQLLGEGHELFHTPHHLYLEGPKVHKIKGWYYILAPGGGVQTGWQVVFRSRHLLGPYEEKVVLEQGGTPVNGPHQGALVDLVNDEWWFLHFQDVGPFGRIVHMQPVRWVDDWPLMGVDHDGNGVGEPVAIWRKPDVGSTPPPEVVQTSDEFDGPQLGRQWQWLANHQDHWVCLSARPGWLRLFSRPSCGEYLGMNPGVLMQKFPARTFSVETLLELPQNCESIAGLTIIGGGESAALVLMPNEAGRKCDLQINGLSVFSAPMSAGAVILRVDVDEAACCSFHFALPGQPFTPAGIDFQTREGGWIGAKVGLFCQHPTNAESSGGYAEFDYFRFHQLQPGAGRESYRG